MTPDALRRALRLYLVVDPDFVRGAPTATLRAALAGGVTMVQLRSKHRTDRETLALGHPLRALCRAAQVPFLVNDRLDLALALDADGIHLGVDDLPLDDARRLAGPGFLIGYSPETDEQARTASENGADYLGIGPIFGTSTKVDAGDALGPDEFARRRALTSLPVVAIGGVRTRNATAAIAAGADGIAVVSAILGANDPEAAARELADAIRT
ncbi:MAG: thiamine phosphate synthase [Thermomicrobiales bacterium]